MASTAWKDLERRVCRALGVERRPSIGPDGWARGSDDDGRCFFAVEVKRTKRLQLRAAWLAQARRNAKASGRPWLIAIGTHGSPRIVAVLDFYALVQLAQEAGRIEGVHIDPEGEGMSEQETPTPAEPEPEDGDEDEEGKPDKA
jgi:hypothetical protein